MIQVGQYFVGVTSLFQNLIILVDNSELQFLISSEVYCQPGFDFSPQFCRFGGFPHIAINTSLPLS